MSKRSTIELGVGESTTVGDHEVTYVGSGDVHFGGGVPPDWSLMFDVAHGDESERVTQVGEDEWTSEQSALGLRLRVVTPYQQKPKRVKLEVEVG